MRAPQAHFPRRAPIDAYGNGGFRFADMSHRGSILIVPSGVYAWDVTRMDDVTPAACAAFLHEMKPPAFVPNKWPRSRRRFPKQKLGSTMQRHNLHA